MIKKTINGVKTEIIGSEIRIKLDQFEKLSLLDRIINFFNNL